MTDVSLSAAVTTDRGTLLGIGDRFIVALLARNPALLPLAPDVRITENGKPAALDKTDCWNAVRSFTYRQSIVDVESGSWAFLGRIVEMDWKRSLCCIRVTCKALKIVEVEILFVRQGDHAWFAPDAMPLNPEPVWDMPLLTSSRVSRERNVALADGYFNAMQKSKPELVAFHPDCWRNENGVWTTSSPPQFERHVSYGIGFYGYSKVVERRYPVIDVERGLILAIVVFQLDGTVEKVTSHGKTIEVPPRNRIPRSTYCYELFKIEDGRIRAIMAFLKMMPFGSTIGWPAG
jgi:hypothetical protein